MLKFPALLFLIRENYPEISLQKKLYILMVQGNTHKGALEMKIPVTALEKSPSDSSKELPIAIDSINSKRTIELVDPEVPEFNLTIQLECRLLEVDSDISMDGNAMIHKVEKEINKKIESEIKRLIQYSHDINTDIFQFGEYYKAQYRNANIHNEEWYEMFSKMKVNVTVNTTIIRDGVFQ